MGVSDTYELNKDRNYPAIDKSEFFYIRMKYFAFIMRKKAVVVNFIYTY